jgi:acyl transferase domain-containing protein/phosphopantetheinyl transferase (holo-ACP synthase)
MTTSTAPSPGTAGTAPGATAVAIVGMAVLLPGARDLDTYWDNLVGGVDCITDAPPGRWDPEFYDPAAGAARPDRVYCRRGGFVDEFAEIDPLAFGIMPDSVPGAEPDQLLALRVAAEAIADAGGRERLPASDRIGVILGRGGYLTPGLVRLDQRVRTANQLVRTLRELLPDLPEEGAEQVRAAFAEALGPNKPEAAIGLVPNLAASRIANRLDVRGPAYTVDAACASSLVAVDQAVAQLASGRCDAMLAGGVHHCHDITFWSVFSQLGALSRSERIRPFHRGADGILIGEGTGVVVLKRLDDALTAGDRVYAVIRGTGVASDGRAASLFNPEPAGQVRAVRAAWAAAGLDPRAADALGLLEAHGTATPAGDGAELATLAEVFGPPDGDPVALGSVKSMIGHTMPAAGIASLVKAALAVHHGVLPPTLHCDDPHPELKTTRFEPIAEARPWPRTAAPRRAGVNAFGFGGINAHVVLEQVPTTTQATTTPPGTAPAAGSRSLIVRSAPERILKLAAADPAALAALLDASTPDPDPLDATSGACRIAIADPTPKKLALARRILAHAKPWRGRSDIWFSPKPLLSAEPGANANANAGAEGRVAFIFPGLEADFTPRVDDIARRLGVSIADHSSDGIGAHGVGVVEVGRLMARALDEMGVRPAAVAGHSVGEWTAMISAGLFSGPAVDRFIGDFDPASVQVPGLVFGAIGAGADRVAQVLMEDRYSGVALSHDNAPNQCVVCGPQDEVGELIRQLRRQNVLCQVLPFRSGFHTPMLEPYLGPILEASARFELHPPTVPVWSATIAAPFPDDQAAVRELFVRHLVEPVRFHQLINAMHEAGFRVFVQAGTGALATVVDDVLSGRDHLAVAANVPQRDGLAQLRRVAAALWVEGMDVSGLDDPHPSRLQPQSQPRPQPQPQRRGMPTKLDLGGALVSLGGRVPALSLSQPSTTTELGSLDALAARQPVAAEVAALLRETAATAGAVIAARLSPGPAPAQPPTLRQRSTRLDVSVEAMPYLLDHCFFKQREDWPDVSDLFPVVPATTVIHHMMDAAQAAAPGLRAVAVHGARFDRWTAATPPVSIDITATPDPATPGRLKVAFGTYARAAIDVAPQPPHPPAPWPVDRSGERPAHITAAQLYADRWMFHGPRFQGVTELTALGDAHVRGVIAAPAAPGALLDNVGQLLGYWIMATHEHRTVVFPVGMRHIAFFGPPPAPGTMLECHIRIRTVDETDLIADAQLTSAGRVWAEFTGWSDRRFGSHPDTRAVERAPGSATLAHAQPGGWFAVFDRWADPASRDLRMRSYLSAAERSDYESCSPRGRKQWLLGRIAVKDAARRYLWEHGAATDPLYPAELHVWNEESGRPRISGTHGTDVPPLAVSIAHGGEVGVALVRPGGPGASGVGIDVEQIVPREQSTRDFVLTDAENALLRALAAEPDREALWFARFWTAKEAVAKAEATGLHGNPRAFTVVAADESELIVVVAAGAADRPRRYQVRTAVLANPDDLPARSYTVAWTEGPDTHIQDQENDA